VSLTSTAAEMVQRDTTPVMGETKMNGKDVVRLRDRISILQGMYRTRSDDSRLSTP